MIFMKNLFNVPKKKLLSNQAVITLVNHTIFQFGNSLSLIFINLYLWRLTKKSNMHHRQYYMKYLPLLLRKRPEFFKNLVGWLIVGLPQGILMYIPYILLFTVFPSEKFIGNMNIVFFGLSIIASYIISRVAHTDSTLLYLWIAAIGLSLSSFFLLWEISVLTVIIFMAINSVFKPLQANAYAAHYYQWIGLLPLKRHFRVESIVLRETIINIGRALGVLTFMFSQLSLMR